MKRIYFPTCVLMIMLFFGMMFSSAYAQRSAKGYKGKRFSVNYDLFTFPNLSNYTYSGTSGWLAWNTRHYLGASYVVGRNKEISLQAGYHRTGIRYYYEYNYTDNRNTNRTANINSFLYLSGFDFNFTYRVYPLRRKGTLAPIGPFFGIGLMYGIYNGSDSLSQAGGQTIALKYIHKVEDFSTTNWGVKMEFGSQRIFFDRLLFRMNFQFVPTAIFAPVQEQIPAKNFLEPKTFSVYFEQDQQRMAEKFSDLSRNRLDWNMVMSLNVGIGYLIF